MIYEKEALNEPFLACINTDSFLKKLGKYATIKRTF